MFVSRADSDLARWKGLLCRSVQTTRSGLATAEEEAGSCSWISKSGPSQVLGDKFKALERSLDLPQGFNCFLFMEPSATIYPLSPAISTDGSVLRIIFCAMGIGAFVAALPLGRSQLSRGRGHTWGSDLVVGILTGGSVVLAEVGAIGG